jgi:hypothetical protein
MTPKGKIYASEYHEAGAFHHSSLAQGKPVAAVGELTDKNGNLIEVSNRSGHYEPSQGMNDQLMHELKERGLSDKEQKSIISSGFDYDGHDVISESQYARSVEKNPDDYIPYDWWK